MRRPEGDLALQIGALSKSFGGVLAVDAVDLAVPVGERRALIGPNGAGKTTLFNLIAGELTPDDGTVRLFGTDVTQKLVQERARLGIGRTYQISQLFLNLTVEQNLYLAAAGGRGMEFDLYHSWHGYASVRAWVREVAGRVGMTAHLRDRVSLLSHGLQRQLEVGLAMAMRPRLIMLDEPAAGLAPGERVVLRDLIRSLPREVTVLLIEHDVEMVLDVADRITVLNRGQVLFEGTPAEVRTNREVQSVYLGAAYV